MRLPVKEEISSNQHNRDKEDLLRVPVEDEVSSLLLHNRGIYIRRALLNTIVLLRRFASHIPQPTFISREGSVVPHIDKDTTTTISIV